MMLKLNVNKLILAKNKKSADKLYAVNFNKKRIACALDCEYLSCCFVL